MKTEHAPGCMCDPCIRQRVILDRLKREQDALAEAYIKRRGGLPRPPNLKQSPGNGTPDGR